MISNNAIDNTLATESTKPVGIRMSENCTSIVTALIKVSAELKPIEKNGKNTFQNYNYARIEDIIDGVKKILNENKLFCLTSVNTAVYLPPKQTKNGVMQCVMIGLTTRLIHSSGEWIEINCYGEGQDSGDKAAYKAITGARKYALTCLLTLSTTDDPENDSGEKNENDNYQTLEVIKSTPTNHNKQQSNGHSKKNLATTHQLKPSLPFKANNSTGELLSPKEDCDITLDEVLDEMRKAKTVKELIDTFESGKSHLLGRLTVEDRARLFSVKEEMKGKVIG